MSRFFFQAEDGIRDAQESRGLGDVYKRQTYKFACRGPFFTTPSSAKQSRPLRKHMMSELVAISSWKTAVSVRTGMSKIVSNECTPFVLSLIHISEPTRLLS